jgi:hypothetical protein
MRYAVLTLAILFATLSAVALSGLGWRILGWYVAGAFQDVLHTTRDPAAQAEMAIWSAATIVSVFFTVRLITLYRRQWK